MSGLKNDAAFFNSVRQGILGPTLTTSEVNGCNTLLRAMGAADWPVAWAAYGFGTAYHETAGTLQPITEQGGDEYKRRLYDITGTRPALAKSMGNIHPGDGVKYAGRGYVQLTWFNNYQRADTELKLGGSLVLHPERALEPDIAAAILTKGCAEGWFSGKSFATYLPHTNSPLPESNFIQARRVINGQDRAADVAHYAFLFQQALIAGGWA